MEDKTDGNWITTYYMGLYMTQNKLEITYLKEADITPYINNTRTHSPEQIEKLKSSIKEFGMATPIGIHNGTIVYGHARFEALKALGYTEFPTVDLSYMTEAQRKAYVIADNRLSLDAGWDNEMLAVEMQGLQDLGFDLELTGFDMDELLELDINLEGTLESVIDESKADEVPEVPEVPVIKLGDLIELGNHRVLCGDSTKEEDVKRLMDGKKADMVFTDPPYGVSYSNNMNSKHEVIKNDDVFLDGWIPLVQKYSQGFIFMWTSYQVLSQWFKITEPFGKLSNMVVWAKGGGGLGDLKGAFATDYELALVWNRKSNLQDKRIGSVWSINKDGGATYVHPTQKPVELMEKGIFNCSKTRDIIMDLFLGSGSTLIASENLTRKCYGMELDEKYAQVIIQRWCDYTSIDTIKINGKEVSWSEYKETC
jgi:DNA modification methylase